MYWLLPRRSTKPIVQYAKKAFRTAAKLDVWPSCFANRRHIEPIVLLDERALVRPEPIASVARSLHAFIEVPAAVLLLLFFDERGECKLCESVAHE